VIISLIIQNLKNKNITQQKNQSFNKAKIREYPIITNKLDSNQNKLNLTVSPTNKDKSFLKSEENEVGFTGVKEEPIPKEETEKLDQENKLINQLPIENDFFSLDFDYKEAFFIVKIKSPKEENKKRFQSWLNQNYPLIPKDQFIFQ